MVRQNNTSIITILRRYSKVITAFLVVNFLTSLVYPIASFALTSGPTNPDYTSFEPVDITDMVNLQTGDFVYNIPLLEVPGPAGGYPISLAYHAGIPVNRESSWVGLGWDLNPGAINRSVNGFPDDHKDVTNTTRTFWEGGTTKELKVGLTVGLPGTPASVSGGISVARDTYKGSGTGFYFGVGGVGLGYGPKLGYTYSQNPITGINQNATLGLSYSNNASDRGFKLGANTGVSTNFTKVNAGFGTGVSAGNYSLLGASIGSSNGGNVSSSVGGFSGYIHNSNAGNISTRSRGFGISIPIYKGIWLDLAKSSYRYWIDETKDVAVNGALDFYRNGRSVSETAFDTYSVPNDELFQSDLNDPDKVMGGTFIDYDQYSITGQGISGEMRPYAFQRHLYQQHKGDEVKRYYTTLSDVEVPRPEFRFVGDFSNRYEYNAGLMSEQEVDGQLRYLTYDFQNPITGEAGNATAGINENDGKLYGSRDIQYFDNADIATFNADIEVGTYPASNDKLFHFVETNTTGFERSASPGGQIGAFIVTNESGVRYHYTLPAYSFDEIQFSERIDKSEGDFWNKKEQPEKYAYTWHLTAITGPDYVDRGGGADGRSPDGELGGEDWGYWVEFDYGKWTDEYHWRNPGVGFNRDLDGEFRNASSGTKELYYLDAIRTKSHTALFHKSIRADNKGRSIRVTERGGSEDPEAFLPSPRIPVPSLKLDKIELVQNTDLPDFAYQSLKDTGFEPDWTTTPYLHYNHFLTDNVLDDGDELAITYPSLRTVNLEHSYDLQPETVNSYDADGDIYATAQPIDRDYSDTELNGKLTLGAIDFAGKSGISLIPKTKFKYENDESPFSVMFNPLVGFASGQLGEIYRIESESGDRVGYYYFKEGEFLEKEVLHLGGDLFTSPLERVMAVKTKNPPFDANAYDTWSMYKADVDQQLCEENEVLARSVTSLSASNLDVWSLRKITTPMGADIKVNYQPDKYNTVALAPADVIQITGARDVSVGAIKLLEIDIPYSEQILDVLQLHTFIDISLAIAYDYNKSSFQFLDRPDLFPPPSGGQFTHHPRKWFEHERGIENHDNVIPTYLEKAFIQSITEQEGKIVLTVGLDDQTYPKFAGVKKVIEFDLINETDNFTNEPKVLVDQGPTRVEYTFYNEPDYVYGGYASRSKDQSGSFNQIPAPDITYVGGGIAVSSILLTDILDGETSKTEYTYNAGVTSYEPYGILPAILTDEVPAWVDDAKTQVSKTGYDHYHSTIAKSRDAPAPGIMYGTVKMDQFARGQDVSGHSEYEFETFSPGMLDILTLDEQLEMEDNERTHGSTTFQRVHTRTLAMKDYTAHIGNLKSMKHFDKNGTMISETVNHFLSDNLEDLSFGEFTGTYENLLDDRFNSQGVVEETFADARFALVDTERYYLLGTITKRERFPSVLFGTTTIDHKTGLKSYERYLEFDYYSGQSTLTYSRTGGHTEDTKFVTKSVPAYKLKATDGTLAYEGMGLKGQNLLNKNLLTQEGVTVTYKMDDDFLTTEDYKTHIAGIAGANMQTWSGVTDAIADGGFWTAPVTQENIFRKRANYSYNGTDALNDDGTHQLALEAVDDFENSWQLDSDNEPDLDQGWRRNGTITLYNVNSQAMESVDLNGNYSSVKMDYRQERVIAQAGNADYDQFASTGFEYALLSDGLEVGTFHNYVEEDVNGDYRPHTGARSMLLYEGQNGVSMTIDDPSHQASNSGRSYQVSVWSTKADGLDIVYRKGAGAEEIASKLPVKGVDGWYLHRAIIPWELGEGALYFSMDVTAAELQIDDFRVHPVDGAMSSFVYNDWGELSYVLDQNNIYTQYRYDEMGRLRGIYRETFQHGKQLVSEFDIHYAELEDITEN